MEQWTIQHRVFAYDTFVLNGESVIATQRIFRRHFNIGRNGAVPSRNTILRWVEGLRLTGNIAKKKPPGPRKSGRTPENIARVTEAIMRSPSRSARQHAVELQINRESVRKILRLDLKSHPHKMQVIQQLNVRDYAQRQKTEGASNNEEKTDIAYHKPCTMDETKVDVAEWNKEYFECINTETPKKELDNSEHVSESFSSNYVWNKEGMVIKTESPITDYEKTRSIDDNEQDAENKYENREETKNYIVVWDSDSYLKSIKVELLDQEDDNSGLEPPSSTDDMRNINSQTMGNEDIDKRVEIKQKILKTLKVPTQTQYEKSLINDISNDEKINTGTLIEKPFLCDVCNKQFDSEICLRKHALMHTGTGKSSICDDKKLNINKQVHTRERSLGCDVCHKRFNQRAKLISHKRIHTREELQN